ncbi:MAG: vWA domain-containing protein [Spirochaetia bacterium]
MKKNTFILFLFIIININIHSTTPVLYSIVLDASGSITHEDFRTANDMIFDYISQLEARSFVQDTEFSMIVLMSHFGGPQDFNEAPPCIITQQDMVDNLRNWMSITPHPQYGETAIYSALSSAYRRNMMVENRLETEYLNVILLITDGADNSSTKEDSEYIQSIFPTDEALVFIIGVGNGADVGEFVRYADNVTTVNNFRDIEFQEIVIPGLRQAVFGSN